ncbi:hypothetical protein [Nonomuraea sp. 10N515B]|uniref:hypothetical protein n=1 Tax=Nonomuraea sp. 10N515B TaxID=3457422 RepID=UPI003FCEB495
MQALEAIYRRLLSDHGDWGGDTLEAISDIMVLTGRSVVDVEAIEAEMLESSVGWPIARVHADQVTGYIHQAIDGGIVVDLYTRDQAAADRLRVLVDGQPVYGGPLPEPVAAARRARP